LTAWRRHCSSGRGSISSGLSAAAYNGASPQRLEQAPALQSPPPPPPLLLLLLLLPAGDSTARSLRRRSESRREERQTVSRCVDCRSDQSR